MIKNHTSEKLVPIEEIIPNPRNPNTHDDNQIGLLAKIIKFQGWRLPIVVSNQSGFIVRGHGRLQSAKLLNLEEVPVSFQDYENDAQEWSDLIADNRIAELAEIDRASLKDLIEELDTGELDMDLTGFDQESLEDLMSEFFEPEAGNTEDDQIPQDVTQRVNEGDLWKMGSHYLMCGDCTNEESVKKLFNLNNPQIMVTDPPYGVEYDPSWRFEAGTSNNSKKMGKVLNDNRADWTEAWALFQGDVAYVYHAGLFASVVEKSLVDCEFQTRSQIIWVKDRMALSRGDYHWKHEPCWYAVRKGKKSNRTNDRSQVTVWEIPSREDSGHGHGTQKPVQCMYQPIINHNFKVVYDPFLGSGTTIIACERAKKQCVGFELNPPYCDVIIQRWEDFTGKKAEKLS